MKPEEFDAATRKDTWWHDQVRAAHKMVIRGLAPPMILELTQQPVPRPGGGRR